MTETEAVRLEAYAALVHEVGDDPAFVAEIIDDYLKNSPRLIEGMREAIRVNQAADLGRLAHELKSSSAWLGADRLAELCREIEVSARNGSMDGVCERIREIGTESGRVHEALRILSTHQ